MKKISNILLTLLLVLALAGASMAQAAPTAPVQQQQPTTNQVPPLPAGSVPMTPTPDQVSSLSNSLKDLHIIMLSDQLLSSNEREFKSKVQPQVDIYQASEKEISDAKIKWEASFQTEVDAVKKANKWPSSVVFSLGTVSFVKLPPGFHAGPHFSVIPDAPMPTAVPPTAPTGSVPSLPPAVPGNGPAAPPAPTAATQPATTK